MRALTSIVSELAAPLSALCCMRKDTPRRQSCTNLVEPSFPNTTLLALGSWVLAFTTVRNEFLLLISQQSVIVRYRNPNWVGAFSDLTSLMDLRIVGDFSVCPVFLTCCSNTVVTSKAHMLRSEMASPHNWHQNLFYISGGNVTLINTEESLHWLRRLVSQALSFNFQRK